MSVMMELSVLPTDKGESLSPYVARCLEIIDGSGLSYKLGPMGTTLEGKTAGEVFAVIDKCLTALQRDCKRIEAVIRLDWRAGEEQRMEAQVHRVEDTVGHKLHT